MKPIIIVGILLIVLGVVALAYQGVSYTTREKIIDLGPIEASRETKKTIPMPPILGGLALAGGIALVVVGSKSNSPAGSYANTRRISFWTSLSSCCARSTSRIFASSSFNRNVFPDHSRMMSFRSSLSQGFSIY